MPKVEQALDVKDGFANNAQAGILLIGATCRALVAKLGEDTVCRVISELWGSFGEASGKDWKWRLAGARDVKRVGNAFACMLEDWGHKMGREWFVKDISEKDMTFKAYCFFGLRAGDDKICNALMDFHRKQIEVATDGKLEFFIEKGPPVCIFHVREKQK